jgi:hypothetical protein
MGLKPLLNLGFLIVLTALRLSSSTTSSKILGHFLKTTQLVEVASLLQQVVLALGMSKGVPLLIK